jgi:hypothetical protein
MPYQDIQEGNLIPIDDEIDEANLVPVGIGPPDRVPVSKFKGTLPGPMTGTTEKGPLVQGPRISGVPSLEEIGKRQKAYKRSIVPTKAQRSRMSPKERLKQTELEAQAEGRIPNYVRSATPEESQKLIDIEKEQEAYEKFGPTLYGVREGINRGFKGLAHIFTPPSTEAFGPNMRALSSKEIKDKMKAGDRNFPLFVYEGPPQKLEPYEQITKRATETPFQKAIAPTIETALPLVVQELLTRRGGTGPSIGPRPSPELTAGAPRIGPGKIIPTESLVPTEPLPTEPLQLRSGRTIVGFPPVPPKPPTRPGYLPPAPERLARLDPRSMMPGRGTLPPPKGDLPSVGRLGPMADMGVVSRGQLGPTAIPKIRDQRPEESSFDLLPSPAPGKAPVLLTPEWVIAAVTGGSLGQYGGVNFRTEHIPWLKNQLLMTSPSKELYWKVEDSLNQLIKATEEQGLKSISLIAQGQDLSKIIPHETFHAGQVQVAEGGTVFDLHRPEWARNHPVIREIIDKDPTIRTRISTATNPYEAEDILAAELPTYVAAGQSDQWFDDPVKARKFLFSYYRHLAEDVKGPQALDILKQTARMTEEGQNDIDLVRRIYESGELPTSTESTAAVLRRGSQGDVVRGVSETQGVGALSRRGRGADVSQGGQVVGESPAPTVPARPSREIALERFLRKSAVKVPVHHGTGSPTEITQVDPSKFDPNALYGPGFYTTQDPDVAAGDSGYVQKAVKPSPEEYNEVREKFYKEEADRIGFNILPGKEAMDSLYRAKRIQDFLAEPDLKLLDDLDEAVSNAMRKTDEWERDYRQGKPHAYQLYLNIERPFDINAPFTMEDLKRLSPHIREWIGEDAYALTYRMNIAIRNESADFAGSPIKLQEYTGNDFYEDLKGHLDKEEINQLLQEAGYDGITHIGGLTQFDKHKIFFDRAQAEAFANKIGAIVKQSPFPIPYVYGADENLKEIWILSHPNGATVSDSAGNPIKFKSEEEANSYRDQFDEAYTVSGHKVWIAFKPEQVKSATGNVGTFDPTRPEMSLSTTEPSPTFSVGDTVKVKSYGREGKVTKTGTDEDGDWAEVTFEDGTTDERYLNDLTRVGGKSPTPKVPESNPVKEALEAQPIVSPNLAESLPGIEAPVKREMDINFPPPQQKPLPGIGSELPPLEKKLLSPDVMEALANAFTNLLKQGGIKPDPLLPVFLQVREAILDQRIAGEVLDKLLEENGLTPEDLAELFENTASQAGRMLSSLSRTNREEIKIVELMRKDPELAKKIIPAKARMEAILREIENGQLGRGFFHKAGDLVQKFMLSDFRVVVFNSIVTAGRIPIMGTGNMIGAWLKHVVEGKRKGKSLVQALEGSFDDAMTGLEAASEMISAFSPKDLMQIMITGQDAKRYKYDEAITQLKKFFPDLHRQLVTPGFGVEKSELEQNKKDVKTARQTLKEMRIDVKNRDEYVRRLGKAEDQLRSNVKGIGRALSAVGYPLDKILAPSNWAEMFFRGPMFYGHLNMRLHLEGIDLGEMIRDGKFKEIPENILEEAVDQALYITHSYMPKKDRGAFEAFGRHMVLALNKVKFLAPFTQQWFPRALYNSLKFAYEHVPLLPLIGGPPLGGIGPAQRIFNPKYNEDPKRPGVKIPQDPATFTDYSRLGLTIVGTVLYGIAEWLRSSDVAGPEWYQIKTGKKGKNGEPIYWDIKRYQPLATFVYIADLNRRMRTGLMGDLDYDKELLEALSGMGKSPETAEYVTQLARAWNGEENGMWEKAQVGIGRQFSWTTRPFVNLRDAWAGFSEDENKRKDLKGSGMLGPLIDNVPWLRGYMLPNVESPTQEAPKIAEYPLATFVGGKFVEGENFAGREWRRLGLYNTTFLQPDSDPIINRAQNEYFRKAITDLGHSLEESPFYKEADDDHKAAIWELYIREDEIAKEAHEAGLEANPDEAAKREILRESGGRLENKANKTREQLDQAFPKK